MVFIQLNDILLLCNLYTEEISTGAEKRGYFFEWRFWSRYYNSAPNFQQQQYQKLCIWKIGMFGFSFIERKISIKKPVDHLHEHQ